MFNILSRLKSQIVDLTPEQSEWYYSPRRGETRQNHHNFIIYY
jgi:hypothetical protein